MREWRLRLIGSAAVMLVLAGCTGTSVDPTSVAGTSVAGPSGGRPVGSSAAPSDLPQDLTVFVAPSSAAVPIERQQDLQAALERSLRLAGSTASGATAAVVTVDGSWSGSTGTDGAGVALTPDAMMAIASITKTVTAAEILALVEAGQVQLDAPASSYLDHPLLLRQPTVRQLLSHTSGVPEHSDAPAFVEAIDADPARSWTAREALGYATTAPAGPGGAESSYSNSNYLLLGMLIEKVTGLSYAQAVRRDVLAGSGARLVVQDAEPPIPPLAAPDLTGTGTVGDGRFLPNRALATAAGAAGGIAADAATLADWGYRLYGGLTLPADRTVDLTTPVTPGHGVGTLIWTLAPEGTVLVGHNGRIPGYSTLLTVDPSRQIAVAVLVVGDTDTTGIALDLLHTTT